MTKDPTLAAQFKAAMLDFNKAPTNDALAAALKTAPAFASLCAIAGLVSFDYKVPLANAGASIGAHVWVYVLCGRVGGSVGGWVVVDNC